MKETKKQIEFEAVYSQKTQNLVEEVRQRVWI
jgi:hypothetical protein